MQGHLSIVIYKTLKSHFKFARSEYIKSDFFRTIYSVHLSLLLLSRFIAAGIVM